ncbi:DUF1848 domain-containing protein [Candidatus Desulfovibrio trichonymphae]|uniref:DUF1848 domain-containing protein n=1 Tax=Candidatus Desulfovibrio trichonymphae TaxID=1725232 RepID=UPI001E3BEB32|nr:DUF1848 domain-containing protein [Candidatus Desulfovibrio trichonymphae]
MRRINALGRVLSPHTDKLVFSFLDVYRKIRKRLAAHPCRPRAPAAARHTGVLQDAANA